MRLTRIIIFLMSGLLVACTVGPNYKSPAVNVTNKWASAHKRRANNQSRSIHTAWWKNFKDPVLDGYLRKAVKNNYDLKIVTAKLQEARAMRAVTAASLYPQVAAHISVTSLRISNQGPELGFLNRSVDLGINRQRPYYNVGFDASWELDVFGKNKRTVEVQDRYQESVIEEKRDLLLTLLAEVTRNYIEMRSAQAQEKLTTEKIKLERKILILIRDRNKVGTADNLEFEQEQSLLHSMEASLPVIRSQYFASAYQIAVLIGLDPNEILLNKKGGLPSVPKVVPLGLRSDILRRRPDVRKAERELASATAAIGVAVADLYPQFTLKVDPALQSLFFNKLFNHTSGAWEIGPFMSWNIFDAGRTKANIKIKEAQTQEAFWFYKKIILNALKDTEEALTRFNQEKLAHIDLMRSVQANRRNLHLSQLRYSEGEDDMLAFLENKKALNQAEIDMVNSQARVLEYLVSLYKSLGGGWEAYEVKTAYKGVSYSSNLPYNNLSSTLSSKNL